MNQKILTIQLKPTQKQVERALKSGKIKTLRKSPHLVFRIQNESDGSVFSRAYKIPFSDLHNDTEHTMQVAVETFVKVQRELRLGVFKMGDYFEDVAKLTLKDFIENYLEYRSDLYGKGNLAKSTIVNDNVAMKILIEQLGENFNIHSISRLTAIKVRDSLLKTTFEPGTINTRIMSISTAFSHAQKNEIIGENPFSSLKKLTIPDKKKFLEDYEAECLLVNAGKRHIGSRQCLEFALNTGLRVSEVLNAKESDVSTKTINGEECKFLEVYNKKKRRFVRLDLPKFEIAWEITQERIKLLHDKAAFDQYMETSPNQRGLGNHRQRRNAGNLFFDWSAAPGIGYWFSDLRDECGLPETITFHALRRTHGVNFLEAGGDVYILKERLGHESVKTTEKIYLRSTPAISARFK